VATQRSCRPCLRQIPRRAERGEPLTTLASITEALWSSRLVWDGAVVPPAEDQPTRGTRIAELAARARSDPFLRVVGGAAEAIEGNRNVGAARWSVPAVT